MGLLTVWLCVLAAGPDGGVSGGDFRPAMREARSAYQRQDWAGYLKATAQADGLEPNHPMVLHNLAGAYALNGKKAEALAVLQRLLAMQVDLGVAGDGDFDKLKGDEGFTRLVDQLKALQKPIGASALAFHTEDKELLVEGIAHDPKTGRFLLSSVHQRKVLSVDPKTGAAKDLVKPAQDGVGGILGMEVDAKRRRLWVVSNHVPEMNGFSEEAPPQSAVFVFDLGSGKTLLKAEAPAGGRHGFNDLVLTRAGGAYVADSASGGIYSVSDKGVLKNIVPDGTLASPGGLALTPDEKTLLVAAWGRGLHAVELATGAVRTLTAPADTTLYGLDTIRLYKGALIATQNGVKPDKVLRLTLDPALTAVTKVDVLERAHPLFHEPTLGVVVNGALYYVANSQWERYGPRAQGADAREKTAVLKLSL